MLVQVVYEFLGIALGPQKFLEIHGVHLVIFLVAHAVGLYLTVVDTHQRARADDVEAAVEFEELQRGGTVGACLQFVKEEQGSAGDEPQLGIEQRDVLEDGVYLEAIVKDGLVPRLLYKVDFNDALVVL